MSKQVKSKAAIRKDREVAELVEIRMARREEKTREELLALVKQLDRKVLESKQAAMITALLEHEHDMMSE